MRKLKIFLVSAALLVAPSLLLAQDATSSLLQLLLMGNGLHQNDWGTQTNSNLSKIEAAIAGTGSLTVGSADYTMTDTEARNGILVVVGTLSNSLNLIAPARTKSWVISNQTSGAFNVTFKPAGGTGVILPAGNTAVAWSDGSTMRLATPDLTSINSSIAAVTTTANGALQRSGGTMTNDINLGSRTIFNVATPTASDWVANKGYVDSAISSSVSGLAGVPAGAVMAFNLSGCPTGWLAANGSAVALDLRGEFIRGLDSGRGVDAGRALASAQSDLFKSHTHDGIPSGFIGVGPGSTQYQISAPNTALTGATGGSETRPRNVALLYCVKS